MATVRHIYREFTPGEAERIAGVSGALQRDWRRRGLMMSGNKGKWTRFSLFDLIQMRLMNSLSRFGFSVQLVGSIASLAGEATEAFLFAKPGSIETEDGDQASQPVDDEGYSRRYIVVGPRDEDPNDPYLATSGNIEACAQYAQRHKLAHFLIIDCAELADQMAPMIEGPILRIEVDADE